MAISVNSHLSDWRRQLLVKRMQLEASINATTAVCIDFKTAPSPRDLVQEPKCLDEWNARHCKVSLMYEVSSAFLPGILWDLGDWSWIHHPQILTKFLFLPYKPQKGLHKQFEREWNGTYLSSTLQQSTTQVDSTSSKMLNTQIHPFAPRLATFSANFSNTQVVLYHTSELIETGTLVSFPDPVLKFGYETGPTAR